MRKNPAAISEGDNVAAIDTPNAEGAPAVIEQAEATSAATPARTPPAPIKPGARMITLAQARAHHAKA